MSYKPIDGTKEEFRKYLDRKGVLDSLTKVISRCYYERPDNPLEFLLENMSESKKTHDSIDILQDKLNIANTEIENLKQQLAILQVSSSTKEEESDEEIAAQSQSGISTPISVKSVLEIEEKQVEQQQQPVQEPSSDEITMVNETTDIVGVNSDVPVSNTTVVVAQDQKITAETN